MAYFMECNPSSPTNNSTTTSLSSSIPQNSSHNTKQYKGVVLQPNGRWGAQLYEGSKRIWVGTFDTQELAARAYDTAVLRFRGPHAATNFPTHYYMSIPQLNFLASHSKERVLDMLRTHTYLDELARFMRARIAKNRKRRSVQSQNGTLEQIVSGYTSLKRLFEKVVTPSDVGRLHRLVIPKQYAERYLPRVTTKSIMLSFEDVRGNKIWRFKYSYWPSSQNYVLTKGWGQFVKNRGLKPGDMVGFYTSRGSKNENLLFIDTCSKTPPLVPLGQESCNTSGSHGGSDGCDGGGSGGDDDGLVCSKMFRLFGFDIPVNDDLCKECNINTW